MIKLRHLTIALLHCLLATHAWADIVVGQVIPLSGVQAPTGKELSLGAKSYIDYVNASGGVNGTRINYQVRDDGYKPEETVRLANDLIVNEGAIALLVGVGTANGEALAKSGVMKAHGVPMIGTRAGASSLYGPDNQMIFHLWGSYGMEMNKIAKHCATVGMARMGVVYQNDAYGQDVLASLESAATDNHMQITAKASYERGTLKVEDAVSRMLAENNSDSIVIIGVTTSAAEFIKQYRSRGGAKPIFGMSVYDPVAILKAIGPDMARGVALAQVVPNVAASTSPLVMEFRKVYAKFGPPGAQPSSATLQGYISAKVFVEAVRASGNAASHGHFDKAMETLNINLGDYPVAYGHHNRISRTVTDIAIFRDDGRLMF